MNTSINFFYIILFSLLYSCSNRLDHNDIIINRLVYSKIDKRLFTGTLHLQNEVSLYKISFCNGMPCGEYSECEINGGGCICKGTYLNGLELLSQKTKELLSMDTVIIDHWQEGELPTFQYPPNIKIIILKEEDFFKNKKKNNVNIYNLANSIFADTKEMNYQNLQICFVNSIYNWSQEYSRDFIVQDGRLEEISTFNCEK